MGAPDIRALVPTDYPEPGTAAHARSFGQRVAATRVDLFDRIRDGVPPIEHVPGSNGRYVAGRRHYLPGPKKTGKSFTTALDAIDITIAGGRVVIFDRENGGDLYAGRIEAIVTARQLTHEQQQTIAGRLDYYEFPRLTKTDETDLVNLCLAANLVVFDSQRMFLSDLGLDENDSNDYAEFMAALIDPLFRAGIATLILDNAGHTDPKRGRGSSSKADLNEILFTIEAVEPFDATTTGRLRLEVAHSRLGTSGRWELDIGGGTFGHWRHIDRHDTPNPAGVFRPTRKMEHASTFIESCADPVSRNTVVDAIGGNVKAARVAIDVLVREGYLRSTDGPRGAKLVESLRPYREADDATTTTDEANDRVHDRDQLESPDRVPTASEQLPLNHAVSATASDRVPTASTTATSDRVPVASLPYGETPTASNPIRDDHDQDYFTYLDSIAPDPEPTTDDIDWTTP